MTHRDDELKQRLRAARLFVRAVQLFHGNQAAARTWLSSPQPALGEAVPSKLAETEEGALEVERVLGRIEHGVFS